MLDYHDFKFNTAILPPVLIPYYIYRQDKFEKEPKGLIIKSFLFGCISVIPILILEIIFNENLFPNLFVYMFCGVAFNRGRDEIFFLKNFFLQIQNLTNQWTELFML